MTEQEKALRFDEIQKWIWWLERRTDDNGKIHKIYVDTFLQGVKKYSEPYHSILELKVNDKVQIANENQINFPSQGTIIEKDFGMSKVSFTWTEVWYDDKDLIKIG